MNAWKRISCAVDLSEPSREAMEDAAALAAQLHAELTLVHVFAPPPAVAGDVLVSPAEAARVEAGEVERALEGWRQDAERRAGMPVKALALHGEPGAEILKHARNARVDLVVVGTHGRTGLNKLLLGSVAERVVATARCPVLTVRGR